MLRSRVLPVLGLFLATAVVTGALTGGVYARGLAFTLGPVGTLAHVPAVALLLALAALLLVRVKGLSRAQAGLTFDARDARALAAATLGTALGLAALVAVTAALTGHPLARSANPVSVAALALALASFVGSSAVQQITTQSFALAASPNGGLSRGGVAFGVAMFTLAHVQVSQAPLYLANVALFGLVTTLLFAAPRRPSYALPLGFHAGWNWAQVAVLGAPTGAEPNPLAPLRWPAGPSVLFGGANGLDEGLLFTAALVPFFALARWVHRRPIAP
jgi:hypothetical protein